MAGSSIATPGAAAGSPTSSTPRTTPAPHAARDVDDLRLAHGVLTTRWASHPRRRLGARDLAAFHRAFGTRRMRSGGRLDRDVMLEGAGALLGDWFAAGVGRRCAVARTGSPFAPWQQRRAFDPASRARHAADRCAHAAGRTAGRAPLGDVPSRSRCRTRTRRCDFLGEPGAVAGHGLGQRAGFTALRGGGLQDNTFEIEVHAQALPRVGVADARLRDVHRPLNTGGRGARARGRRRSAPTSRRRCRTAPARWRWSR